MISWSLALYISEWVIRLIMLVVVPRRRTPSAAMAWLLVIFFEPWLGLAIYLLLGDYHLPRRRAEEHARLLEELQTMGRRVKSNPNIVDLPVSILDFFGIDKPNQMVGSSIYSG